MANDLEIKQILTNLKSWACWDFKAYPLQEKEAAVIISALEECLEHRSEKE